MGGFFKIYRGIFQHEIFKDELGFRLFMLIAGNAVYAPEGIEHKGMHLKRGQWVRSYRLLANDLERKERRGYKKPSISTIKRAVDRLIKLGLVSISETDNGTLFTVINYEKYQGFSEDSETLSGTDNGTLTERYRNKTKKEKKDKKEIKKEEEEWNVDFTDFSFSQESKDLFEIKAVFSQLVGRGVFYGDEEKQMEELLDQGIPLETILEGIRLSFERYKPKRPGDKIKKFKYCYEVILDLHAQKEGEKQNAEYRKRNNRSAKVRSKRYQEPDSSSYSFEPDYGYYNQYLDGLIID